MKILVTGGLGFIGSNWVDRLLSTGKHEVRILDNLSRVGVHNNLEWLEAKHGKNNFELIKADVREAEMVNQAVEGVDQVFHLAAQVAVTTSVTNPREDFEINAGGTFNVLEAARFSGKQPLVVYASTNKVYGEMEELGIVEAGTRYKYQDVDGVSEAQSLDFHSPYGCSKGCGDQYVRDYGRIYGLPTVVLRQSCIYGYRQFGMEDQGWVAWFIIAIMQKKPITIYGDGKQVRDILFIDDLIDLYEQISLQLSGDSFEGGRVFNVGGGIKNTVSIWAELGPMLEKLFGRKIEVKKADWRPGDQKVMITDIGKLNRELGWQPKVWVDKGVGKLYEWITRNKELFG